MGRFFPSRYEFIVNIVAPANITPMGVRLRLYRAMGIDCASVVAAGCRIGSSGVRIGAGCMINRYCYFDDHATIVIEDHVWVWMGAMFVTTTHPIGPREQRAGMPVEAYPIRVGRGSWIGARSLILPGVTVADGCVVAAGSVLVESTEKDGLYVGVPARRVRDLSA